MKLKTLISALASVLLIGSQVAHADKWGDQFPHIAATGDIPGMCSYESMSKKDYSGRTLTINTHAIPVMGEPTALHAEQFEKLTGAKVEVVSGKTEHGVMLGSLGNIAAILRYNPNRG